MLRSYIEERVERLFDSMEKKAMSANLTSARQHPEARDVIEKADGIMESITLDELEKFKSFELHLIDNPEYFRSVFE